MTKAHTAFVGFALGSILYGCAYDPVQVIGAPVLDSQFGAAVTRARAMQIINPEGVPVNDGGYSGKAAYQAIERYDGRALPVPPSNHSSANPPSSNAPPNAAAQASR